MDGDGVDEVVAGAGRLAVTAGGVLAERAARGQEDRARQAADRDRLQAEADRARAAALQQTEGARRDVGGDLEALAVLRVDDRSHGRTSTEHLDAARADEARVGPVDGRDRTGVLDPEVADARTVAGRNQALPATEAVRTVPEAAHQRPARRRGRGQERDRAR